jgi:ribosomal protein S18 acetylase RimI-like enzyme
VSGPADAPGANRLERTIRRAASRQDFECAHDLFVEYGASLDVDLSFQGFAEEVAGLPGAYAAPRGRILLAHLTARFADGAHGAQGPHGTLGTTDEVHPARTAAGCIALRPLVPAHERRTDLGEIKRLYVRPDARGHAVGYALVEAIVAEARHAGYRELRLDTLPTMHAAQALYRRFGFQPCAPYYDNPLTGVVYLALAI